METKNATSERSTKTRSDSSSENHSQLGKYFLDSLKDIYWAEKHLTKALPKMSKAATTQQLKSAFDKHLKQTEGHVTRLEKVFDLLGKNAQGKKCEAMEGLTKEGESIIDDTEDGSITRDVGLIMAAQKVEHYEIATYGGLVQLAKTIGEDKIGDILGKTLEEEKETDKLLSSIAENGVNAEAEEEN